MSNQVVPNTEHRGVACLALAWEIVNATTMRDSVDSFDKARIDLTNDVLEVYTALYNMEPIESQD